MPAPPHTSVGYRYSILEIDWDVSLDPLFSTFKCDDSLGSERKSLCLTAASWYQDLYPSQDVNFLDFPYDSPMILWDTSTRRSLAAITKSADLPGLNVESQCRSPWQSRTDAKPRNDSFVAYVWRAVRVVTEALDRGLGDQVCDRDGCCCNAVPWYVRHHVDLLNPS